MNNHGFTLIELLVVVSIIGLLAATVLGSLTEARTAALYAVVKSDMNQIASAIVASETNASLISLTGSGCTFCRCRDNPISSISIANVPETSVCFIDWKDAIDRISADSNFISDPSAFYRDPWGSPYMLDENEGEFSANPCRPDWIRSVGQDGRLNTSDDYVLLLPFKIAGC